MGRKFTVNSGNLCEHSETVTMRLNVHSFGTVRLTEILKWPELDKFICPLNLMSELKKRERTEEKKINKKPNGKTATCNNKAIRMQPNLSVVFSLFLPFAQALLFFVRSFVWHVLNLQCISSPRAYRVCVCIKLYDYYYCCCICLYSHIALVLEYALVICKWSTFQLEQIRLSQHLQRAMSCKQQQWQHTFMPYTHLVLK